MSRSSQPLPLPLTVLFAPSERVALERGGYTATRNKLVLSVLNNVKSQLVSLSVQPDGRWREDEATAPAIEGYPSPRWPLSPHHGTRPNPSHD